MIIANWKINKLPGIDSISKRDGTVVVLNCYRNEEGKAFCFPFCETTIESLLKFDEEIWTEIQVYHMVECHSLRRRVYGGEGGMGNEGFLACTDLENEFLWAGFFENSNPFIQVEILGDKIIGYSSYGFKYILDLVHPENIEIVPFQHFK